ncbi:MAG: hypothetical protein K2O45_03395 [Oscillospiraceae bacterium]|nr:hypothetical protein [Oscillospiraceae bacterium]
MIAAPDLHIAGWLLEHRRFDAALIDLNCMFDDANHFWTAAERCSLAIIVMGLAGTKYAWPVEHASDRFLSYDISPQELAACIEALLQTDHS